MEEKTEQAEKTERPEAADEGACRALPKRAVLFATDGNDLAHLKYALCSVDRYMKGPYDVFVLAPKRVELPDGVMHVDPEPCLEDLGFHPGGWNRRWPYAVLYRLAIPLLPELAEYERVLYLDTDVLVRSTDANDLMSMSLDGYEAVGATDIWGDRGGFARAAFGDLAPEAAAAMRAWLWDRRRTRARAYVNGGVVLWNVPQIRRNGAGWYRQRLLWFWEAETRGRFKFLDQDFVNVMMDTAALASLRYNAMGGDVPDGVALQHFVAKDGKARMRDFVKREGYDNAPTEYTGVALDDLLKRSFVLTVPGDEQRLNAFYDNLFEHGVHEGAPAAFQGFVFEEADHKALGLDMSTHPLQHQFSCGLSHFSMVCAAKAMDWPYVLIFEDDARITRRGALEKLARIMSWIPAKSRVIKIGCTPRGDSRQPDPPNCWGLVDGGKAYGSPAYVVFREYYDTYIELFERYSPFADTGVMSRDWAPEAYRDRCLGIYRTEEHIFTQQPGWRDASVRPLACTGRCADWPDEGAMPAGWPDRWHSYTYRRETIEYDRDRFAPEPKEGLAFVGLAGCVRVAKALHWPSVEFRWGGALHLVPSEAYDAVCPAVFRTDAPGLAETLAPFRIEKRK